MSTSCKTCCLHPYRNFPQCDETLAEHAGQSYAIFRAVWAAVSALLLMSTIYHAVRLHRTKPFDLRRLQVAHTIYLYLLFFGVTCIIESADWGNWEGKLPYTLALLVSEMGGVTALSAYYTMGYFWVGVYFRMAGLARNRFLPIVGITLLVTWWISTVVLCMLQSSVRSSWNYRTAKLLLYILSILVNMGMIWIVRAKLFRETESTRISIRTVGTTSIAALAASSGTQPEAGEAKQVILAQPPSKKMKTEEPGTGDIINLMNTGPQSFISIKSVPTPTVAVAIAGGAGAESPAATEPDGRSLLSALPSPGMEHLVVPNPVVCSPGSSPVAGSSTLKSGPATSSSSSSVADAKLSGRKAAWPATATATAASSASASTSIVIPQTAAKCTATRTASAHSHPSQTEASSLLLRLCIICSVAGAVGIVGLGMSVRDSIGTGSSSQRESWEVDSNNAPNWRWEFNMVRLIQTPSVALLLFLLRKASASSDNEGSSGRASIQQSVPHSSKHQTNKAMNNSNRKNVQQKVAIIVPVAAVAADTSRAI